MEPRIQYAKTEDSASIALTILGSGDDVLISASAIFGDLHLYRKTTLFRMLYDNLASGDRRVVLYDSRNTGTSEHRDNDYSSAGRLADLEAVVEHIGAPEFTLYAILQGCLAATEYAARHPDRVKRLVLASPFARGSDLYTVVPEMAMVKRMRDQPITAQEQDIYYQSAASIITGFGDAEFAASFADAMRTSMSPEELMAFTEATREVDTTNLLPNISVPTLVVFSHNIMSAVLPLSREVARLVPGAEFLETGEPGRLELDMEGRVAVEAFIRGDPAAGAPAPAPVPASDAGGLRIVLFTDIESSTELTDRLGDEKARDVIRSHEAVVREALGNYGGSEVKTMGDGFMASFTSASQALDCAIAIQRANQAANENADEPLRVRIGLNAGEPIAEQDDLFGTTVIRAARIAAIADGGEVLVSNVVRELSEGKSYLFTDRGDAPLRGFEETVRLYELGWRAEG